MNVLLLPFLNVINKKYQKGEYERILRGFSILHSNNEKYSTYVNIHRVGSLLLSDDSKWESEYRYIVENNQLDILGLEDKKYIILYFFMLSAGKVKNIYDIRELNLSKVSKRTRKYFPWVASDMKSALKKTP